MEHTLTRHHLDRISVANEAKVRIDLTLPDMEAVAILLHPHRRMVPGPGLRRIDAAQIDHDVTNALRPSMDSGSVRVLPDHLLMRDRFPREIDAGLKGRNLGRVAGPRDAAVDDAGGL